MGDSRPHHLRFFPKKNFQFSAISPETARHGLAALRNASLPRWRLSTTGPFHERTYLVISLLGDAAGSGDGEIAKVSHAFQPRVGSPVGPEFTRAPTRGPGSGSTATLRGR